MAVDAYIAEPFVFQTLFVDISGVPIAVLSPNITIIRFDGVTGDEIVLVAAAPMTPAFPPDPGRFVFVYTIPATLLDGDTIYAETRGTDPATLFVNVSNQTVNAKSRGGSSSSCCGLNARFVK